MTARFGKFILRAAIWYVAFVVFTYLCIPEASVLGTFAFLAIMDFVKFALNYDWRAARERREAAQ